MSQRSVAREIVSQIKKKRITFVNLQFTDILGALKSVSVEASKFESVIKAGMWFDGSSIEGFARIFESDMLLQPDLSTFVVLPWSDPNRLAARVICDIIGTDGEPFACDPRGTLRRMTEQLKREFGLVYNVGAEVEFFLFERNGVDRMPHDHRGYFDYTPVSRATDVCEQVILDLAAFGIEGEVYHHEVAPGQHEIDIKFDNALLSADNIITLKTVIKARTSSNTPLVATFMPKPIEGVNGSGMHVHQSMARGKNNVFFRERDQYNLSALAYQFIAGQLQHVKALAAIVAPTVNSYKRLVPGYEAPVNICWGVINRSALIRIPRSSPQNRRVGARAELRCPDPYCNPYIACAAMLAAGMDGMRTQAKPPQPVEENVYHFDDAKLRKLNIDTLPGSLNEALTYLQRDTVLREALGDPLFESYLAAKREEAASFRFEVTPKEIERYL